MNIARHFRAPSPPVQILGIGKEWVMLLLDLNSIGRLNLLPPEYPVWINLYVGIEHLRMKCKHRSSLGKEHLEQEYILNSENRERVWNSYTPMSRRILERYAPRKGVYLCAYANTDNIAEMALFQPLLNSGITVIRDMT